MQIQEVKTRVSEEIDRHAEALCELSLKIHTHPELGFEERKAASWLTEYLSSEGFEIIKGICDMPTAFEARYGKGHPAIAFLAEYDALPSVGHACGHNIIATSSTGAAIGVKPAINIYGGSVYVIGTPAEEMYGGKVIMANRGWFRNLDATMLVHPDNADIATAQALACQTLDVEFIGKASHAAARPEIGINALEALLLSFTAINALRQHIRSTARIHGIITDGGQAVNVVPAHSAGTFLVRARDDQYLDELKEKVLNCFTGAATATGAELKYKWDEARYATMRNNIPMAKLYQQNMQPLDRNPLLTESGDAFGSTDMGNVSHLVPSIQPYVGIARGIPIHTPEFAIAAASEDGMKGMLDAAKGMAWTAVDLLGNPAIMNKVKEDFHREK